MLGMTDFSMIPTYFIDQATLLHGTSSVNETGGGLGGAVRLETRPSTTEGIGLQYVQGIGSFRTFDEYVRFTYGDTRWRMSTRVLLSSSPNDYKYRNHDKKENIYDDEHRIIGQYYPVERNRSGSFRDLHILQEVYCEAGGGNRLGLNVWYLDSNRELAMLTTDYGEAKEFDNRQRENTLRSVVWWELMRRGWKVATKGGYIHTWMGYDYQRDLGNGTMAVMTCSRSWINSLYGQVEGECYVGKRLLMTASLGGYQHFVVSKDKNIILQQGDRAIVGYDKGRIELSGSATVRWRPTERIGVACVVREELYGTDWTPLIPALFIDLEMSRRGNIVAKGSVSRNFRYPSLNDLYFLPGGNPELRCERGWTYDTGVRFEIGSSDKNGISGGATWFDSYIDDWIIWLPTVKGFFSPRNLKKVHAYGVELQSDLNVVLSRGCKMSINGTFSWTPSINIGVPMSPADQSVGRQLPYVPEYSSSVTGRLSWRTWTFLYKWCWYSERYTMSSNDITLTGRLPDYFMSNISLEKVFVWRRADMSLKLAVNNLFNEEYLSVLSRPMPGINFEIFIGITPKWGHSGK